MRAEHVGETHVAAVHADEPPAIAELGSFGELTVVARDPREVTARLELLGEERLAGLRVRGALVREASLALCCQFLRGDDGVDHGARLSDACARDNGRQARTWKLKGRDESSSAAVHVGRYDAGVLRYYHGTRAELALRAVIAPASVHVLLTTNLDEAIWSAELAAGDEPPRVYVVEPLGQVVPRAYPPEEPRPSHPHMGWSSREPLRVVGEVTEWVHYHGTRADLRPGDLIEPGHVSNFGATARTARYVYFTRTLDAATWGAELAVGEGRGRIYVVEPTGPVEDDPNLTNARFRGNPTKSFRSRDPLRITGEIADWRGHAPEAIAAMKAGIERLARQGVEALEGS